MPAEATVLVLADCTEPQFRLLDGLPHLCGTRPEDFAGLTTRLPPGQDTVILSWAASRDFLRNVFLAAPRLRWVHSRSAGLDSVLFPELVASDVPLTNGSGVFSPPLGEFAIAGMLYFAKDFPRLLRNQQARRWEPFDVDQLTGHTLGIVGYGDIGRAVALRARAMSMRILALKRHPPREPDRSPDPLIDEFFQPARLHDMLARCDYLVVSAPLTPETRHMISTPEFAVMKPTSVLINIGRGPVVDQAALIRVLSENTIRGAALDVFEQEPLPADNPLYGLPNVLLSPHSTDHTRDWLDLAMRFFLAQYERFRKGEPLQNVVNKHLGY